MKNILDTCLKLRTWVLVDLLVRKFATSCKWVYYIKTCSNDNLDHYKTHLVAKKFIQEYEIDYIELFTPIANLSLSALSLQSLPPVIGYYFK